MTYRERELEIKLLKISKTCSRFALGGIYAAVIAAFGYCNDVLPVLSSIIMFGGFGASLAASIVGSKISK